jgi:hypothetical protein
MNSARYLLTGTCTRCTAQWQLCLQARNTTLGVFASAFGLSNSHENNRYHTRSSYGQLFACTCHTNILSRALASSSLVGHTSKGPAAMVAVRITFTYTHRIGCIQVDPIHLGIFKIWSRDTGDSLPTLTLAPTRSCFKGRTLFVKLATRITNATASSLLTHSPSPSPCAGALSNSPYKLFRLAARDFTTSTHPIPYFPTRNIS